ncbi:MAG: hypothetical protein JWL89_318 [Candidatus Saccharibacteria bacterium]|nr:hypothetical protein [Candidatus Saccharibacteria bacterium]
MTNNYSQSNERRYSSEDMADVAMRKYIVDIAAPYAQNTLLTHFPAMFTKAPTGEVHQKPAAKLDAHFAAAPVAEAAINSVVAEEARRATDLEDELAATREAVAKAWENPNEAAA